MNGARNTLMICSLPLLETHAHNYDVHLIMAVRGLNKCNVLYTQNLSEGALNPWHKGPPRTGTRKGERGQFLDGIHHLTGMGLDGHFRRGQGIFLLPKPV